MLSALNHVISLVTFLRAKEETSLSEETFSLANHRCKAIINRASGVPVVFLHGYSYTSAVWQRTGITELLKEKKVPFVALDMPYGARSDCQPHSRSVEVNVAVVKEAVQTVFASATPVLVGASLGAHMALQFAARFPVKGLLLVGAVRVLEEKLLQAYSRFKFPVRIIIGSEDRIASIEELRTLTDRLQNAKLTVYEGEGHSAYLGSSDRFSRDLLELYAQTEQ
jgi:pimeloyl-ACP methyl ester carboxylesterase